MNARRALEFRAAADDLRPTALRRRFRVAEAVLVRRDQQLDAVAAYLLERETMERDAFLAVMEGRDPEEERAEASPEIPAEAEAPAGESAEVPAEKSAGEAEENP